MTCCDQEGLVLVPCVTDELMDVGFSLRHKVFSEEFGFEASRLSGREVDSYDACASHFLLKDNQSGEYAGYFRLINGLSEKVSTAPFKSLEYHPAETLINMEVSRFLILSEYRSRPVISSAFQCVSESLRTIDSHVYILIERRLGVALMRDKYCIMPVSEPIRFRGERMVCIVVNPHATVPLNLPLTA